VYNLTAIWVERQRQKILKEKGELSEEDVVAELRKRVDAELRLDYLVTGSKVPRPIAYGSCVLMSYADGRSRLARKPLDSSVPSM
jgi:hypothetical protein